ncbi:protein atonal homolog 1-like [Haliotis rubra]|uniref:protein atonal homolog 1-like n=1 Tax=Haliotis rubra TaxID=36100 RepID=UPI001EE621CD|nr:protein atonal homolog 1-like [Haliotis rubra]XP_046571118.1 protein atonal homolog 1-like [Haliotis rubra]
MASVEDGNADSQETKDQESEPLAKRQKREKYNLRQKTLVTRIETEERLVAPKQPKPKSRPPPLSKYRRKTANSRERGRMKEINTAFEELQTVLPNQCVQAADSANLTKITTLRLAVNYIAALREVLGESCSAAEGGQQEARDTCVQSTHAGVTDALNHVATDGTTDVATNSVADGATDITTNTLHGGGRPVQDGDAGASNPGRVADSRQDCHDTSASDLATTPGSVHGAYNSNVCDSTDTSSRYRSRPYTEGTGSVPSINDAKQPESDLAPVVKPTSPYNILYNMLTVVQMETTVVVWSTASRSVWEETISASL